MSGEQDNKLLEPRVCLPKPDVNNITVLTQSLPNDPILPWHHYDSPWLERDPEDAEAETDESVELTGDSLEEVSVETPDEQLTLQLQIETAASEPVAD